jgi:1-acyl-sn-glycerol-3-phosphate acyltransferase
MNKQSKGYNALRIYVRFAFWLTHKKIVVVGRDNIPEEKPIIFAANHQNALMDPLALVLTNPLQTLWLTRADIFKSSFTRPILKFMKMIPIYRIRDGKDSLANNEEIFKQVTEVLEANQSIALFPEAAHSGKRQMLPHKKAIPRIALEAEEKNNFEMDLQLVPTGIFYDHYWKFNRTLLVQYGKPIGIDSYKEAYNENTLSAMLSLREDIRASLEPLTMQINSGEHYIDYENFRAIAGEEYTKNCHFSENKTLNRFKADQEMIRKIEHLELSNPTVFKELTDRTQTYMVLISRAGYSNQQLVKAQNANLVKLLAGMTGALLSFPVVLVGALFSILPFLIPRQFLTRKIKDPAFRSSINFAVGLLLFPIFYLMESSIVGMVSGSLIAATVTFVLIPFAGKYAYQLLMFDIDLLRIIKLRSLNRQLFKRVSAMREGILAMIRAIKS